MTTIMLRRGTAAEWTSADPVLAEGEQGFEKDTGKLKIGDGTSAWSALDYFAPGLGFTDADDIPDGTTKVIMTAVERAKLASPEFVQDIVASMFVEGTGITKSYDDTVGTLTVSSSGGSSGLDSEAVRDLMNATLLASNGIGLIPDDAGDHLTITLNSVTTAQVTGLDATIADLYDGIAGKADSGVTGLPPLVPMAVHKVSGTWPSRPTTRNDIPVFWIGPTPAPTLITTPGVGGMLDGVDVWFETP